MERIALLSQIQEIFKDNLDEESIKAFGLDVVTDLCEQLRAGGAPGLHFYSMNQSVATLEVCHRLGL